MSTKKEKKIVNRSNYEGRNLKQCCHYELIFLHWEDFFTREKKLKVTGIQIHACTFIIQKKGYI
jgi:hypothetical protein